MMTAMNLTHVLGWGASFNSLSVNHHIAEELRLEKSSSELSRSEPARILLVSGESSSGRVWRSNLYSCSGGGGNFGSSVRCSNAVSTRPRGPKEEDEGRRESWKGSPKWSSDVRPNDARKNFRNSESSTENSGRFSSSSSRNASKSDFRVVDGSRAGSGSYSRPKFNDVRNDYRQSEVIRETSGRSYGTRNERTNSNDDSRRAYGSGNDPRGDHRRAEGTKQNMERYRNSRFQVVKSGEQSEVRYGRKTSSGGGRRGRRDREKKENPCTRLMQDEEGELVVVWGTEPDNVPLPTPDQLNWKKAAFALPGEPSDEMWAKVFGADGSSGSYSVKGVEQGGMYHIEDDYEEESEDDFEEEFEDDVEDDFEDDFEDDSDSDFEEPTERPKVTVSRPPKVKVFGRDLWGKAQPKVKSSELSLDDGVVGLALRSEGMQPSAIQEYRDLDEGDSISADIKSVGNSGLVVSPSNSLYGKESQVLKSGVIESRKRVPKSNDNVIQDDPIVSQFSDKCLEKNMASSVDDQSLDRTVNIQVVNKSPQRLESVKSNDSQTSKKKEISKIDAGRQAMSSNNEDEFAMQKRKPGHGAFNPNIIDVSEEGGAGSRKYQNEDVSEYGLLDRLRLQATGKAPFEKNLKTVRYDVAEEAPPSKVLREAVGKPSVDSGRLQMQDLNARNNFDASIAHEFFSLKSFKDVGASPEMIQALSFLHVKRPSNIQAMAFKSVLEGKSCIIAEQTGSGKTLAYVAPMVQRLRAEEVTLGKSLSKKPRVLVLVPTGELAAQVLSSFRAISKGGVPCRSIAITGGFKWKTQVESLENGADVVVATPGRLLQQLEAGNIQFDNLQTVILDEVDILFDDEEFSTALETVNRNASIKAQYIHVTATLPVDIHDSLLERYPDCLSLMGPNLHRTSPGLQEILVDCSGEVTEEKTPETAFANKKMALLQLVDEKPVAKTIVFCNKMETCRKVENILSRHDRSGKKTVVLPYHAALSQEARLESLETFMKSQPKQRLFLVCTDRASRGIDSLDVEHVVLFDFPRDPSEYVRRIGRTARGAGGTGKVFAFVVGTQVRHARQIMARNDKGEPVHDVPGSRYYYSN